MSNRYKGGVISATPPTTTGGESGTASGAWTLEQQMQLRAAGLWPLQPTGPYIEELFSTYLYTGNATARSITNEIDLAGKGGLVWIKQRTVPSGTGYHFLYDSARGGGGGPGFAFLSSNTNAANGTNSDTVSTFNSNGFSLGADSGGWGPNQSGSLEVSWTFRKQPKFFDVLTYTGNGTAGTAISHSLGSTPGFILVKRTDTGGSTGQNWVVWHRSAGGTGYFNSTNALDSSFPNSIFWGNGSSYVAPTSTTFTVTDSQNVNASGGSYVAYLFAHDAGGFGLTGTDNVISCGSYSGTGSTLSVTLGYEPQWVMIKRTDTTADWQVIDNMRGWTADGVCQRLVPNTSAAEAGPTGSTFLFPTATGFGSAGSSAIVNASGGTYIYIAIRRGPMRTPTTGTSVYNADTTITATTPAAVSGFVTDLMISTNRTNKATYNQMFWSNRLTGDGYTSSTNTTAEQSGGAFGAWDTMNGSGTSALQSAGVSDMAWMFKRAPSFFDEVCYTGTGTGSRAVTHNLGVAPEMVIVKQRAGTPDRSWWVLTTAVPLLNVLNSTEASNASGVPANLFGDATYNNYIAPTATTVTLSPSDEVNKSSNTYVAYLFATTTGVSKVGSYTGTGALQTINCGFSAGARFVLIKRTDSTGDWYTYDSARGITSGNDPYLFLNSTAAEVTGTNYVDTTSVGFQVTAAAPAGLNANGGTYIFLAIA